MGEKVIVEGGAENTPQYTRINVLKKSDGIADWTKQNIKTKSSKLLYI